jgi:hypothetical protein
MSQEYFVFAKSFWRTCPHGLQRNASCAIVCHNCRNLTDAFVAESALMKPKTPVSGKRGQIELDAYVDVLTASLLLFE